MKNYTSSMVILSFFCVTTIKTAELNFYNKSDKPIVVNWRNANLSDHQKNVEIPELMRHYVKNGKPIPEVLNPFNKKGTKYIAPGDKAHFSTGGGRGGDIRLMTVDQYLPGTDDNMTLAVIYPDINWS